MVGSEENRKKIKRRLMDSFIMDLQEIGF